MPSKVAGKPGAKSGQNSETQIVGFGQGLRFLKTMSSSGPIDMSAVRSLSEACYNEKFKSSSARDIVLHETARSVRASYFSKEVLEKGAIEPAWLREQSTLIRYIY